MVDYVPQDEYFEWEEIRVCKKTENFNLAEEMGRQSSLSEYEESFTPSLDATRKNGDASFLWSETETWTEQEDDFTILRSICTSVSLNAVPETEKTASPIDFPSYDDQIKNTFLVEPTRNHVQLIKDDLDLYFLPSRHVDYFSHQWSKEDMSASWRHLRTKEKFCKNAQRLENASWRSWAKMCFDLKTILPESVDWMKDVDDTFLYGPFQEASCSEKVVPFCRFSATKSILKRPSISELLLQGSQLSWTGSRRSPSSPTNALRNKRSVKFNDIVETSPIIKPSPKAVLSKSKGAHSRNDAVTSVPVKAQEIKAEEIKKPNFWISPTFSQPQVSHVAAHSNLSEWTWLTAQEEQEEMDWISPPPVYASAVYSPPPPTKPASVVRDVISKSHCVPDRRQWSLPLREYASSEDDDEDEIMAQYLFDCDFKSDTDLLSASDSCSSGDDHDEDEVNFHDTGDVADEKRMMERLHEIPMMEAMKQTLLEQLQVVDEANLGWE